MPRPPHVVVLGGGISGLSAAIFLRHLAKVGRRPVPRVTLLEASNRLGGWVRTTRVERDDGPPFIFEHGPRGFRPSGNGVETLRLIEVIDDGQLKERCIGSDPESSRNRYVTHKGKLVKLPSSLGDVVRAPGLVGRLALAGIREVAAPAGPPGGAADESVDSFM